MERAYADFLRRHKLDQTAAFFGTRAKQNLRCRRIYCAPTDSVYVLLAILGKRLGSNTPRHTILASMAFEAVQVYDALPRQEADARPQPGVLQLALLAG